VTSLTRRGTAGCTIAAAIMLTLGLSATAFAQIIVPGYPYRYRYAAPDASVRFDVKPKETAVYVDGYYAGLVDDYDGAFQRLRTAPGGHELTLYLEGYRTYSERIYLSADNTFKIRHRMEKLAGGEVAERPPAPQPPPEFQPGQSDQGEQPPPFRGPVGRRGPRGPGFPPNGPDNAPPPAQGGPDSAGRADVNSARGTLALSLQPADAEILVDGTPWRSDGGDRQSIDLSEGRHNIQIRKSGFVGYLTDVQIRRGETTALDVQLKTQPR
jgi:hypothetical protein